MKRKITVLILALVLTLSFSACSALGENGKNGKLTASGFIATDPIHIAPEIGGRLLTMEVAEGDSVQAGEVLFKLEDDLLAAQATQAQAAVDLAQVAVEAADAQRASAQVQADLTLQQAHLSDSQNRQLAWKEASASEFDLPVWYFEKDELLAAAQAEIEAARQNLEAELANLASEIKDASNEDFVAVEVRLAKAQSAFLTADQTLGQAQASSEGEELKDAAQEAWDAAKAELDAAQLEYDRLLSSTAAESVLEARARVAVARARLDNALDRLAGAQTGEDSLQVKAALSAVSQAETAVSQAKANLAVAQAALDLVKLQIQKCTVTAPAAGVVLSVNAEAGELVGTGSIVMTIAQLDDVSLTVYVPEDQYGQISLGQAVVITVDSYAGKEFSGQVQAIADEAEFTPRNVQTVEGRRSTVFAVKIAVPNPDHTLKPGMPADVNFGLGK